MLNLPRAKYSATVSVGFNHLSLSKSFPSVFKSLNCIEKVSLPSQDRPSSEINVKHATFNDVAYIDEVIIKL